MNPPVAEAHNRHAGQGAVLLDIGGSIGALVVTLPAELVGVEIEIRPVQVGSAITSMIITTMTTRPTTVGRHGRTSPSSLDRPVHR